VHLYIRQKKREAIHMLYATFIVIAAVTTVCIFGLIAMLSWEACLAGALSAAALTGGAVFTVQEMRRLSKGN
jgi:hypothetical protein